MTLSADQVSGIRAVYARLLEGKNLATINGTSRKFVVEWIVRRREIC